MSDDTPTRAELLELRTRVAELASRIEDVASLLEHLRGTESEQPWTE